MDHPDPRHPQAMPTQGSAAATVLAEEGEELLQFLYQLPVAAWRMDADGRIDLINPRAASLLPALGLALGGHTGWSLLQALDPATAAAARAQLHTPATVVAQKPVEREDTSGQKRHLALTVTVVSPGHCMVTIEDATSLQEALAARHISDRRYRDLVQHIPAGVVVHAATSEILLANPEASRILGLSLDQLKGRDAIDPRWQFLREDGTPMGLSEFPVSRVLASGEALHSQIVGALRPGESEATWAICSAFPVRSPSGQLAEVIVSFTDITELKVALRGLNAAEERLRLVLRGSNDAPWDWDMVEHTMYYSPRWWQMLGLEPEEHSTDTALWAQRLHPDDTVRVHRLLQQYLAEGRDSFEEEFRLQHQDGHYVDVLCRGFISRNASGEPVRISGTNLDLTERKQTESQIHHLAFYDTLTDLPNRRLLLEHLRKALQTCERTGHHGALLFIDLDRFKELNDTLGHDTGDELLRQVARRLEHCVRETDMVARLGGDEFVVMLQGMSKDKNTAALDTERTAQKVLDALNQAYDIAGRAYQGTPSIGIALFGTGRESVDTLLRQADLAMYKAKSGGRNTMRFFDDSMQAEVDLKVALQADLRVALEAGGLLLHLQPQFNQRHGLLGAEVLVRWQHPERGLLPPAQFIPMAESSGLILPLGQWVLHKACEQLVLWADDPVLSALTLSVNVSVHQLHDPGFTAQVVAALAETGADPLKLKLEITESALAENVEDIIAKMEVLRRLGISFALDDFGTGYSSLSFLKRLPLNQLKIDRAFVHDAPTDAGNATIARIIITLGNELGLSVLAEGVETEEQRQFLLDHGCLDHQGYLMGRPVSVAEFEARFRSGG